MDKVVLCNPDEPKFEEGPLKCLSIIDDSYGVFNTSGVYSRDTALVPDAEKLLWIPELKPEPDCDQPIIVEGK